MAQPGPANTICDVPGIRVGCAEDAGLLTGVTVIVPDAPAVAAVDHRGGGIGSRESAVLSPGSTVTEVHGLALSGGSAYGLDAAGGMMHGLRRDGRGYAVAGEVVPIVPSAIVFDLAFGGPKAWDRPPWWELGLSAYRAAGREVPLGNAGAGLGATAGRLKGGQGSASWATEGFALGALAIVNSVGEAVIPGTRTFWAWMHEADGELGGQVPPPGPVAEVEVEADLPPAAGPLANTTLVVVATDAALTRDQALRVAIMAQDGLAMAIRPAHGALDGDTVYVLSTGARPGPAGPADLTRLGALAASATARAIARGVHAAEPLGGYPAYRAP